MEASIAGPAELRPAESDSTHLLDVLTYKGGFVGTAESKEDRGRLSFANRGGRGRLTFNGSPLSKIEIEFVPVTSDRPGAEHAVYLFPRPMLAQSNVPLAGLLIHVPLNPPETTGRSQFGAELMARISGGKRKLFIGKGSYLLLMDKSQKGNHAKMELSEDELKSLLKPHVLEQLSFPSAAPTTADISDAIAAAVGMVARALIERETAPTMRLTVDVGSYSVTANIVVERTTDGIRKAIVSATVTAK